MKQTYIKPELGQIEELESEFELCAGSGKGGRFTRFGSDLPEDKWGNEDWVNEGYNDQREGNYGGIEMGGDDDGEISSCSKGATLWDDF